MILNDTIIHNYSSEKEPLITRSLSLYEVLAPKTIIIALETILINHMNYPAGTIYIPSTTEVTDCQGSLVRITLSTSAADFDIQGIFTPCIPNDTEKDKRYNSHHTLYFTNDIFRREESEKIKKQCGNDKFSHHLKAELVELLSDQSLVPAHSHGEKLYRPDIFIQKWGDLLNTYSILDIDKNTAHPQLIVVLNGAGTIFLSDTSHQLRSGDVIAYGPHTIHGTKAQPEGMSYIHIGWEE